MAKAAWRDSGAPISKTLFPHRRQRWHARTRSRRDHVARAHPCALMAAAKVTGTAGRLSGVGGSRPLFCSVARSPIAGYVLRLGAVRAWLLGVHVGGQQVETDQVLEHPAADPLGSALPAGARKPRQLGDAL